MRKISNPFKTLIDAYKYTISYFYNYLKYKLSRRVSGPKEIKIDISQLPRDEQLRVLTEQLLKERQEKIIYEQKVKELESQLTDIQAKQFAKILEELYKEEKETGKLPISLYDLLRKARAAGILPFRKPPVVYDITMQRLGRLYDIVIHPDGGIAFVIKVGKQFIMTPPFGSLWDAIFHPENLASQLPDSITLLVYKDPNGNILKVPSAYLNRLYGGEPVEKIIAELQTQINRMLNDLESTKVNAEMISLQNQIEKVYRSVSDSVSTTALNLFEKNMKDLKNILIPTTLAAVEASTTMQLDVAQERSKSEHLQDILTQYSERLKTLESSLAPERIISIQNEIIDRLKQLSAELAQIRASLQAPPQAPPTEQAPKGPEQGTQA